MRTELEEKDAIEMKRTGAKGPAPGGDTWVWLTSYSRVPVRLMLTKYMLIFKPNLGYLGTVQQCLTGI